MVLGPLRPPAPHHPHHPHHAAVAVGPQWLLGVSEARTLQDALQDLGRESADYQTGRGGTLAGVLRPTTVLPGTPLSPCHLLSPGPLAPSRRGLSDGSVLRQA